MADDNLINISEVRRKAWETRRAKYGANGHSGVDKVYKRGPKIADENVQAARDELSSVRRALQVYGLPDVWAHHAIDRIDAADHMLGGPRPFNLRDLEDDLPPLGPQYFG